MLAEASVALMAIQLCKTLGFQRVHFEGDTKIVVNGVKSSEGDWSRKGMLLKDIKLELQSIPQWRMTFIHRDGNKAAHALSKIALKNNVNHKWLDTTPNCINNIVRMGYSALSS
jgi:ribonuclease HI